ncbi:MAG: alkaline phosphatase family protein [Candidatus Brocadiaceae bacterium]|nr:alkaline phosphatase family protein [Candidatus Brocadiaceae bacterium]
MSLFDRFKKSASAKPQKPASRKVVVLGLDGVSHSLAQRFTKDGTMHNLANIVKEGALLQMDSSLPEVSSVAWTSFATGANPATHGVYGFMDLRPGTYKMYFPSALDVKCDTIWDTAGKAGKRSVVINVPQTYPARPIQGILIAGFVAIDLKKATYPESTFHYLQNMGYRIDVNAQKARESLDDFVEDLQHTFQKRKEAILHLFDTESWDLFVAAITETDRLHHFMWNALDDAEQKQHAFFHDFYRELDQFIGTLYDRCSQLNPKPAFMILSDHGFTTIKKEAYLNFWLKENGYLCFDTEPAKSLENITDSTKAFVLDPSRVYINVKGKYPRGSVQPGSEYNNLREELTDRLLNTGIIQSVFKKEELYSGPLLDHAPDLVLLSKEGYDLKGAIAKDAFLTNDKLKGMHTWHDAVFFINEPLEVKKKIQISDVAQLILPKIC